MKLFRVALAGFAATLLMVGVFHLQPQLFEQLERQLYDWRFRVRGPTAPGDQVVLIAIDARSIDALGRWPWPRTVMAALIDRLAEADVAAIGMDISFAEPERNPAAFALLDARRAVANSPGDQTDALDRLDRAIRNVNTDDILEDAILRSNRSVVAYYFRSGKDDAERVGTTEQSLAEGVAAVRRSRVMWKLPDEALGPVLECTGVENSLPAFHEASRRSGFINSLHDRDGVIRHAPLIMRCNGELFASFPLALAEVAAGRRKKALVKGDERRIHSIVLSDKEYATDEGGRVLINYRGPPHTFRHISAVDVLSGAIPNEELAGRIAIIGPVEPGIGDIRNTPFGQVFPGPEVHANVVDNLLRNDALYKDASLVEIELALLIGLGLVVSLAVPLLGTAFRGALFTVVLGGAFTYAIVDAFVTRGLWLNLAYPGITIALAYFATAVAQSLTTERSQRQIRRQFATYVPPQVVEEMTQSPESFKLGGELRELSILFSDVRSFTTLAQDLGAEKTARLMNVYLTAMTKLIFETRGTLDKYIGDAVVAFWNAPIEVAEHPTRVCEVAIDMQEAIARMRVEQSDVDGVERLNAGIGIHTAEVVVGNLGSELRFDYTITGDGVNLCSRLEGLTKYYGVGILCSEALVKLLPEGFKLREIDTIQVVGKDVPVTIFQVAGRGRAEGDEAALYSAYAAALKAFREGDWTEAERLAQGAQEIAATAGLPSLTGGPSGSDGPSRFLIDRVHNSEPPDDWQGVWVFDSK